MDKVAYEETIYALENRLRFLQQELVELATDNRRLEEENEHLQHELAEYKERPA